MVGAPGQVTFVCHPFADVLSQHQSCLAAVELDGAAMHIHRQQPAIAGLMGPHAFTVAVLIRSMQRCAQGLDLAAGTQLQDRHGHEFVARVTVVAQCRGVDRQEAQGRHVEYPERQRIALEQLAKLQLGALQPPLFVASLGDVDDGAGQARLSAFIADQRPSRAHPSLVSRRQHDAVLGMEPAVAFTRCRKLLCDTLTVVLVHAIEAAVQRHVPGHGREAEQFGCLG